MSSSACGPVDGRPAWRASSRSSSPSTPSPAARSMRRWSRSVVASASSRARWVGVWSRRRREASVDSLQFGTSSRRSRRASAGRVDDGRPVLELGRRASSAARTKPRSKEALWATNTASPRKSHQGAEHRLDAGRGADHGVGQPGEDRDLGWDRAARVDQRVERAEALAAADLDHADLGDHVLGPVAPVVSRSRMQNVVSWRGVPRSSKLRCPNMQDVMGGIQPRTRVRVKNTCSSEHGFDGSDRRRSSLGTSLGGDTRHRYSAYMTPRPSTHATCGPRSSSRC